MQPIKNAFFHSHLICVDAKCAEAGCVATFDSAMARYALCGVPTEVNSAVACVCVCVYATN